MTRRLNRYVVAFSEAALSSEIVFSASYRVEGEHLIFLTEDGRLTALFLLEIVLRWSMIDTPVSSLESIAGRDK
jgi:hypothetical protein